MEQLREIGVDSTVLLEAVGRNTAPALTLAAFYAQDLADPILFVTPSDHTIEDLKAFQQTAHEAIKQASNGAFVIVGVKPDSPHTGYGYIKASLADGSVVKFVEKPEKRIAEKSLDDQTYFWNAGIVVVKASVWLDSIKKFRQDIATATNAAWKSRSIEGYFIRTDKELFSLIPPESIDYAVIEQLPNSDTSIQIVPLNAGWNDLGSWDAVWRTSERNPDGNSIQGDVVCIDSSNNYVHATSRAVSLLGVNSIVIVETADAILVADKARSDEVKKVAEKLQSEGRALPDLHQKVVRPWGWYDSVDTGERFKVKRIHVKPGASLSLQKHFHRSEHWVVVKGNAEVTCGDQVLQLSESQATYIPCGEVHRLSNTGKTPLEIIEVQLGDYLGEDDIVRYEDIYGR